ncbi:MAG: aspartate aminotransferase family protein [Bacteroidota bacterium]
MDSKDKRIEAFTNRQLFFTYMAQTSAAPIGLEMKTAEGIYITDTNDKKYIDGIAGFSVNNIGHSHPEVVKAVQEQVAAYMHLIVYGEFIQSPQASYAKLLIDHLPTHLNCVYFTNSGSEAVEGAMKLAKRVTNRHKIIAFKNAYHGSTQGALSIMGDEYWRNAYRPLLPGITHADYGNYSVIDLIDTHTACIIMEVVQAEAGIKPANLDWLQAISNKCRETGTLLVFDEIQSGFGRTGSLWAFKQYGIEPDILLLGKALGGGMPLGAFISSNDNMKTLTDNPVLGHITTFGGHPVSCTAGKAALEVLLKNKWIDSIKDKEKLILKRLQHPLIKAVHYCGLWMALEFESFEINKAIIHNCIQKGLITDWFLFAPDCLRIAPPLSITELELHLLCDIIMESIKDFDTNK